MQHAYVGFGLAIVGDHAYIAGGVKTRNGNYKATDSFYKLNLNSGKVNTILTGTYITFEISNALKNVFKFP